MASSPRTHPAHAPSVVGNGTREQPWVLKTPSGQSEFTTYRDDEVDPPALIAQVGKTELRYQLRCLDDLAKMLEAHGDWMPLGSADEQRPAAPGTVEACGRFANYVPPVMEALGLAEVEHNAKNNRMRRK